MANMKMEQKCTRKELKMKRENTSANLIGFRQAINDDVKSGVIRHELGLQHLPVHGHPILHIPELHKNLNHGAISVRRRPAPVLPKLIKDPQRFLDHIPPAINMNKRIEQLRVQHRALLPQRLHQPFHFVIPFGSAEKSEHLRKSAGVVLVIRLIPDVLEETHGLVHVLLAPEDFVHQVRGEVDPERLERLFGAVAPFGVAEDLAHSAD